MLSLYQHQALYAGTMTLHLTNLYGALVAVLIGVMVAMLGYNHQRILQAAAVLLSTGLALSMAAGPAVAAPKSLEQKRQEQEAALLAQMKKVEYALQQQENARKAELLGK